MLVGGAVIIGLISLDNYQTDKIARFDEDIKQAKKETSAECGGLSLRVVVPDESIHEKPIRILFGEELRDDMDYHFLLHKDNRLEVMAIPKNQPKAQPIVVAQKYLPMSDYCINQLAH